MGRPKLLQNLFSPPKSNVQFEEGQKSKGILDDYAQRIVVDTKILNATTINATTISGGAVHVIDDQTLSGAAYVPNIIFGTLETPPTASNYPQGTLYIQYVA